MLTLGAAYVDEVRGGVARPLSMPTVLGHLEELKQRFELPMTSFVID